MSKAFKKDFRETRSEPGKERELFLQNKGTLMSPHSQLVCILDGWVTFLFHSQSKHVVRCSSTGDEGARSFELGPVVLLWGFASSNLLVLVYLWERHGGKSHCVVFLPAHS